MSGDTTRAATDSCGPCRRFVPQRSDQRHALAITAAVLAFVFCLLAALLLLLPN